MIYALIAILAVVSWLAVFYTAKARRLARTFYDPTHSGLAGPGTDAGTGIAMIVQRVIGFVVSAAG